MVSSPSNPGGGGDEIILLSKNILFYTVDICTMLP